MWAHLSIAGRKLIFWDWLDIQSRPTCLTNCRVIRIYSGSQYAIWKLIFQDSGLCKEGKF